MTTKSPCNLKEKRYRIMLGDPSNNFVESQIMIVLKNWLRTQDIFWRRIEGTAKIVHSKGKMAYAASENKGFPDIIAIKNGKIYGIEVKRPYGAAVTAEQAETLAAMAKNGAIAGIVCNLAGLQNMLDGLMPARYLQTHVGPIGVWI